MKNRKKINSFERLELEKALLKNEILKKEFEIKNNFRDLRDSFTVPNIKNELLETLLARPDIAIKAGMIIFKFIQEIKSRRNS